MKTATATTNNNSTFQESSKRPVPVPVPAIASSIFLNWMSIFSFSSSFFCFCSVATLLLSAITTPVKGFSSSAPAPAPAPFASAFIVSTSKKSILTSPPIVPFGTSKYSNQKNLCSMGVDSFQDGTIQVSRPSSTLSSPTTATSLHSIHYRIHNRMNLSSQKAAPILVLHGGPGVPSDYLYPLADVVPYRSIVYYDQLGCGRSQVKVKVKVQTKDDHDDYVDESNNNENTLDLHSIESSLDDLEILIKKIGLRRFHLYGQSFGGILAFEYMKRVAERHSKEKDHESSGNQSEPEHKCLSVILSSSPTNVTQVEIVANDLINSLLEEDNDTSTLAERFHRQNQCRTVEKPQPLVDAYAHAGTEWRGTDVIKDYVAERPGSSAARMPSALVMRGEYDFVSEECVQGWRDAFNHKFVRMKVLDGCSHHGLLEDGRVYGEIVDSFFAEYD